jgi:Protein of unknown function (DUF1236)
MKKYQNTLLAGVAALALVAGTGLASAQQSNEHGGAMGGSKGGSPQAGQSMSHGGSSGMSRNSMQPQAQEKGNGTQTQAQQRGGGTQTQAQGKGTQTQAQGKGNADANRSAQTGHEAGNNMGQRGNNANARAERTNRGPNNNRQNTAQQQRTLKGLQGNASKPMQGQNQQGANESGKTSNQAQQQTPQNNQRGAEANGGAQAQGGNVQLSEQQRTQIRDTVINGHNAPRVGHVDFDVRVGTVIPRGRIHIVPVPETLVRIEPRWRGFLYFVYEDEVVIVNPRTYHIVAVIPA